MSVEMTFEAAMNLVKLGGKVARAGWNGKKMFVFGVAGGSWDLTCYVEGVDEIETLPFVCMKTADNKLVPWLASQTDILSDDWVLVPQ